MKGKSLLLLAACGVMDLSWYFAWATFLTLAILQQPFPFPEAVSAFVLACLLTIFSHGRGWRIIQIAALQAVFFLPLLLQVKDVFQSWSHSFAEQKWLTAPFFSATAAQYWFIFLLIMLWIFPFWGGGIRLARRPLDYWTICTRFDRGLTAFFVLLAAKFFFLPQMGMKLEGSPFAFLIFSFFLCSLLAIGLAKNRETSLQRDFLPGFRSIGVILGFTVVLLLLCAGLMFFCLPYLTRTAETSYALLKEAAQPVGSFLLMVLRFIFGSDDDWQTKTPEKQAARLPKLDAAGHHSWWVEFFGKILAGIAWVLLALVFLLILGVIVYFFVQWLFSKTALERDRQKPAPSLPLWAEMFLIFFRSIWENITRSCRGCRSIGQIYGALQRWGRRSGLPRVPSETPSEYGRRLNKRFPDLTQEIGVIIQSFNEQVYGGLTLKEGQLLLARSAWTQLRNPLHWPRRLKTWFFRLE